MTIEGILEDDRRLEKDRFRDDFAKFALIGIMAARAGFKGTIIDSEEIADDAYAVADAMLKRRQD